MSGPIILRCPQHVRNQSGAWEPNLEWIEAKLGIPSASGFRRVITKTGRLAAGRRKYAGELCAEWATGEPWDELAGKSHWVLRGLELEPEARRWYEMIHADVEEIGFVYRDAERMAGCSPDGFVGDDGGLEIKCPSPGQHVLYLSDPASLVWDYWWQVQGSLWVTGRAWWDVVSYCPRLPEVCERVVPDEGAFAALDKHIPKFIAEIGERRAALRERGVNPPAPEDDA